MTDKEKETAATEPTATEPTTAEPTATVQETKGKAGETKKRNTRHYKYQLTINNPQELNLTHDNIKLILSRRKNIIYYCLSDETGLREHTPHTHLFIMFKDLVRFNTIKGLFPTAHIEAAYGSAEDNRAYVSKTGKWADDPKADTAIPGTFEESGPLPDEPGQGFRSDIAQIYLQIADGLSNADIMAENPDAARHIGKMDRIRQDVLEARYREQWRDLEVTYIFGPTGTGKTRFVMEHHGYSNVFRVTNYAHPFDRYRQQPVICFDEFRSSLLVGDMLDYLDGYPFALPARYADRQACYIKAFIVSNIGLKEQYPNVQKEEPATWKAFLRRIHHVVEYRKDHPPIDHGDATTYIASLPPSTFPPVDNSRAFKKLSLPKLPNPPLLPEAPQRIPLSIPDSQEIHKEFLENGGTHNE